MVTIEIKENIYTEYSLINDWLLKSVNVSKNETEEKSIYD